MFDRPLLTQEVESSDPLTRARALIELGQFVEAEVALADRSAADTDGAVLAARLATARGELMAGLQLLTDAAPNALWPRAQLLSFLGQTDLALTLLEGANQRRDALTRAAIHLAAGEAAAAAVHLSSVRANADADLAGSFRASGEAVTDLLERAELLLVTGAIDIDSGQPQEALRHLGDAHAIGRRLGATTVIAQVLSRLGEAHADARHRWRALRCTVQAVDLVASGGVAADAQPGIYFRSFQVYGMYGHRARADAAVESGHHLVVQLASGIDDRDRRESFFLENRDCQRLVAAWKGDAGWGASAGRS